MNQPRMPSPAILVAALALIAAVAGTAVAGPDASTSAITKKKVKKIAAKQINKLAPDLSVAHAASADRADTAGTATNADTATNAQRLGGSSPNAFQRTVRWAVVEGSATGASVVRGNATGASRFGMGQYMVSFAPDIRNCAYVATTGDTDAGIGLSGELSVEQAGNPTDIVVRHRDSTGAFADYPTGGTEGFHIAVFC
jgi:hypothetical protein